MEPEIEILVVLRLAHKKECSDILTSASEGLYPQDPVTPASSLRFTQGQGN